MPYIWTTLLVGFTQSVLWLEMESMTHYLQLVGLTTCDFSGYPQCVGALTSECGHSMVCCRDLVSHSGLAATAFCLVGHSLGVTSNVTRGIKLTGGSFSEVPVSSAKPFRVH